MERIYDDTYKNVRGIYKITNTMNGRVYIGSTVDFRQRINSHIKDLHTNIHGNKELQKDFNIHQSKNFQYELLEEIQEKDIERLPLLEKQYINEYKKLSGVYNKNDPTEEFWIKRNSISDDKEKTNNVSKPYIEGYLEGKFEHQIQPIIDKLKKELYVHKNEVEAFSIEDIKNDDVANHRSLDSVIKKWYKNKGIALINFPEYKREFRELYGVTVEGWKDSFVKMDTYEEVCRKRRYNIIHYKEFSKEKQRERMLNKKESTEKIKKVERVRKKDSDKPLTEKQIEKEKRRLLREKYNQVLKDDFELILNEMPKKLNTGSLISYKKVYDYILERITLEELDCELLDNALMALLRSELSASIFNFENDSYSDELMNLFNINEREKKIMSREKGKEIMDHQKALKNNLKEVR